MPFFNLLVLIITVVGVAIFAAQNPTPITLQFIALRSVELPLGWVVSVAGGLGILTSMIAAVMLGWRSNSQSARQLQSRLEQLEQGPNPIDPG